MDWYPWFPVLYEQDTMHLDPYQDGCYRRMIDHYMKTRAPLPDNDFALARICGDSHPNWVANGGAIAKAFFTPDKDGFLRHKRCDLILDDQDARAKSLSESGKKGAEKRWAKSKENAVSNSHPNADPIATPMGFDSTRQDKTVIEEIDKSISLSVFDENVPKPKKVKKMERGCTLVGYLSTLEEPDDMPNDWYQDTKTNFIGASNDEIIAEYNKFCDYWEANANQAKGKKASWKAAWRLWFSNYWERKK